MNERWYKDVVVYELDVKAYQDSDGDGVGDFRGLMERLPHLAGLGVTCLWLGPFYPSPNKDDGYDVVDYYDVDPRLGTLGDFVEFMHQARERGIRVLADLVVNHTSDQHPWFQMARRDKRSPYREYYIWSEDKPENADKGIVFPGVQESIWTYDDEAEAYYHHQFYRHQPDLNIANPRVRAEIRRESSCHEFPLVAEQEPRLVRSGGRHSGGTGLNGGAGAAIERTPPPTSLKRTRGKCRVRLRWGFRLVCLARRFLVFPLRVILEALPAGCCPPVLASGPACSTMHLRPLGEFLPHKKPSRTCTISTRTSTWSPASRMITRRSPRWAVLR